MKCAHGTMRRNSHAIERKKSTGVKRQKKSMHPWVCRDVPIGALDQVLSTYRPIDRPIDSLYIYRNNQEQECPTCMSLTPTEHTRSLSHLPWTPSGRSTHSSHPNPNLDHEPDPKQPHPCSSHSTKWPSRVQGMMMQAQGVPPSPAAALLLPPSGSLAAALLFPSSQSPLVIIATPILTL